MEFREPLPGDGGFEGVDQHPHRPQGVEQVWSLEERVPPGALVGVLAVLGAAALGPVLDPVGTPAAVSGRYLERPLEVVVDGVVG